MNPNICATGVKGRIAVVPTIDRVAINKCFLGLLLNSGFLVLMTRTIIDAEITDSINHAVRFLLARVAIIKVLVFKRNKER